jgi:hypothetical protein
MAYAIVHHFPGGTKEQYEASIAAVHPGRKSLPKGQIFHAAGPSAGGWTIVAVHASKESWEQFRDDLRRSWIAYILIFLVTRLFSRNRLTRSDGPLSVLKSFTPEELASLAARNGTSVFRVSEEPFRLIVLDGRVIV